MSEHALLSASSAFRWLTCPPSARFEEGLPDTSSDAALEGTLAHALAELYLRKIFEGKEMPHIPLFLTSLIRKNTDKSLEETAAFIDRYYTEDMIGYVQDYVTFVSARIAKIRETTPDAIVQFEQRIDYSAWAPEGFGTGDVRIIGDTIVVIIDLKYGKGNKVDAEANSQMRLYGLGTVASLGALYDFGTVEMVIYQPRMNNIVDETIPVAELLAWGETIKPIAALAHLGKGEFNPGEKQCQFCRARAFCTARAAAVLAVLKTDDAGKLVSPDQMPMDEIADLLPRAKEIAAWAKDIQDYALAQAEKGAKVPGYKLVEGRSNRFINDVTAAAAALNAAKFPDEVIYKPRELLGVTELEKLTGKKVFAEVMAAYLTKPRGKPTLVPESDPRNELQSAQSAAEAFANVD